MATTTNYSFNKPTINGSENTWGTDLNGNWDSVDSILYGGTAIQPNLVAGAWEIGGTAVTSTAAELNLLDGAVANTVVDNKAVVYGTSGTITATTATFTTATATTATFTTTTATTANITTVDFGDWTITESAGVLYFATSGTNKMKLDASGNLTVVGNVTAYGTV